MSKKIDEKAKAEATLLLIKLIGMRDKLKDEIEEDKKKEKQKKANMEIVK